MGNWLQKGSLAACCVVASLAMGAGAASAAALTGIKAPHIQSLVATVGHRRGGYYGDYYAGDYYAGDYYERQYYDAGLYDPGYYSYAPYRPRRYSRDYSEYRDYSDYSDYSRYSRYSDDSDYSDYSDDPYFYSYYDPRFEYVPQPTRYYGTRAPREAYERDEYWTWLPPSKPRSCGEFHYWTGSSCVDARHFKPYIGPKW